MRIRFLIAVLIAVLAVAACSSDDESTTTLPEDAAATSTTLAGGDGPSNDPAAGVDGTDTAGNEDDSATSTSIGATGLDYEIAHRSPGDNGDLLVVVVSDVDDGVTDHDLEQLILEVVETFGPVSEAHIIDDASVLELVLADAADLTDDQVAVLEGHYLLRLVDGTSVSFQGPFQDVPGYEIGS